MKPWLERALWPLPDLIILALMGAGLVAGLWWFLYGGKG